MTYAVCENCQKAIFGMPLLSLDGERTLCRDCKREEIHQADLKEIEELWDIDKTPEQAKRFEELVARAYGYEERVYPMDDPTPEALVEFWKDQGIIGGGNDPQ